MCNINSITLTEIIWETFLKLTPLNRRVVSAVFWCFFFFFFFLLSLNHGSPVCPCYKLSVLRILSLHSKTKAKGTCVNDSFITAFDF